MTASAANTDKGTGEQLLGKAPSSCLGARVRPAARTLCARASAPPTHAPHCPAEAAVVAAAAAAPADSWRWEESDDAVKAYSALVGVLLLGMVPALHDNKWAGKWAGSHEGHQGRTGAHPRARAPAQGADWCWRPCATPARPEPAGWDGGTLQALHCNAGGTGEQGHGGGYEGAGARWGTRGSEGAALAPAIYPALLHRCRPALLHLSGALHPVHRRTPQPDHQAAPADLFEGASARAFAARPPPPPPPRLLPAAAAMRPRTHRRLPCLPPCRRVSWLRCLLRAPCLAATSCSSTFQT